MTNATKHGPPPSLAAFFAHAGRFLVAGEGSAEDVERVLGSSPSGTARLALYATLVERQQLEALDTLFPATRRALDAQTPGRFRTLVRRFVASHRSPIAHPGGLGVAFPRFVETEAPTPWAHELVDSERVRYELATSPVALPEHGFDPVFALRRYTHAVHVVDAEGPVPELRPASLLFARDPRTLRVRWLELGTAELVTIGIATGEHTPEVAASLGLNDTAMTRARTRLRDVGWLRD